MAKEQKEVSAKSAGKALKSAVKQKGTVSCTCSSCGCKENIPTSKLYKKAVEAIAAVPAKAALFDKEGNMLREASAAQPFVAGRSLQHFDVGGVGCSGTFRLEPNPLKTRPAKLRSK